MKIDFRTVQICDIDDLCEGVSDITGFPDYWIRFTLQDYYLCNYTVFTAEYLKEVMDRTIGERSHVFLTLLKMMEDEELPRRFYVV